jgi:branched-chain amino acid aminotransferase
MTTTEKKRIAIERTTHSRLSQTDFTHLTFGSTFTDHVLVADYQNGKWGEARIVPYGDIALSPATSALHYGQSIFEGMKAFRDVNGAINLFRAEDHLQRMNKSALRLCMPEVPSELFIDGMMEFLRLEADWVPEGSEGSLYLRPLLFATDSFLGIRPSENYRFMIMGCPVTAYYPEPLRVWVTNNYVRAVDGGVGYVKAAGNYAPSMIANKYAREHGFNVVLWLDAFSRKYIEEYSTMNAFFVIDEFVVTPKLTGTILEGITRDSLLTLFDEMGIPTFEREVSINEIFEMYHKGKLKEAFGTGTAAVVAPAQSITYENRTLNLSPETFKIMNAAKQRLSDIRRGLLPDNYGWLTKISVA